MKPTQRSIPDRRPTDSPGDRERSSRDGVQQDLDDLGAEPLEGSGFENEAPDPDFD